MLELRFFLKNSRNLAKILGSAGPKNFIQNKLWFLFNCSKMGLEIYFSSHHQKYGSFLTAPFRLIQTNMSPKNPTCLMLKQININHPITFLFRTKYHKRYNSLHWLYPNSHSDSMPHWNCLPKVTSEWSWWPHYCEEANNAGPTWVQDRWHCCVLLFLNRHRAKSILTQTHLLLLKPIQNISIFNIVNLQILRVLHFLPQTIINHLNTFWRKISSAKRLPLKLNLIILKKKTDIAYSDDSKGIFKTTVFCKA